MKKAVITSKAPTAIGPYSQAVDCGDTSYFSGQIPLDPASGELVEGGIAEQAEQVMNNLAAVLQAAGLDWPNVVKTTIYLTDLTSFAEVNQVYARHLVEPFPARATVGVSSLPKGALVEIEALARR